MRCLKTKSAASKVVKASVKVILKSEQFGNPPLSKRFLTLARKEWEAEEDDLPTRADVRYAEIEIPMITTTLCWD
jgi:hypothetical protein